MRTIGDTNMDSISSALVILAVFFLRETVWCCSEQLINNYSVMGSHFVTDGFPYDLYRGDRTYCWTIRNIDGGGMTLEFRDMVTEGCCDKVKIYDVDEGTLLSEFSGEHESPYIVTISKGVVKVEFTTDSSIHKRGWQACACPLRKDTINAIKTSCYCTWTRVDSPVDSWSDWSSPPADNGIALSVSTGVIIAGVVGVCLIVFCVLLACKLRQRNARGSPGAMTTVVHGGGTPMRPMDTSNVPPGVYPVQQGVSMYPVEQGVTHDAGRVQPRGTPQYGPPNGTSVADPLDGMAPPTYSAAMNYPSPTTYDRAEPVPESNPPPNNGSSSSSANATSQDTSHNTELPPPSYDSVNN